MEQIYKFFIKPRHPKKIVVTLFVILSILFVFHTSVWFIFTKQILDTPCNFRVGDLVRLSYQIDSLHLRANINITLPLQHIESAKWKGEEIDIISVGDSFSNAEAGGENPYYQDYIETTHNMRVLNIPPSNLNTNYIERILGLYNNNLLDTIKPKIIIIESAERFVIDRFSKPINWDYSTTQEQALRDFKSSIFNKCDKRNVSIINNGNYDFILNPVIYTLSTSPVKRSGVYRMTLKKKLFSVKAAQTLLFHQSDLESIPKATVENIHNLNTNLNDLAHILAKKNIKLVFMPIVDKYNLYSNYLSNNPFNKSVFFEKLRPMRKNYYLLDTKAILQPLVESTQKDIFFADDTHWSPTASKTIINALPINQLLEDINIK